MNREDRFRQALEQIRDYRFMSLNTTKGREQSHESAVRAMREIATNALVPTAEEKARQQQRDEYDREYGMK